MLSFENQLFKNSNLADPAGKPGNLPEKKAANQVWMLTTYPPRECGIATFSQDLMQAVNAAFGNDFQLKIAAIDQKDERRIYPDEVTYIFEPDTSRSYKQFGERINRSSRILSLVIQHEFGLFPAANHRDFNEMLYQITKPIVLVMHTVLPSPAPAYRQKVRDMVRAVARVVVMTNRSAGLLTDEYDILSEKIIVIPHGTHLSGHLQKDLLKERHGLKNRIVLSTFGLMSRNKNIETTLKALPSVVQRYPNVTFLVLGRTHPGVIREEGEAYRRELEELVTTNNLKDHVHFINRYLSLRELLEYLQATDIYLFTSKDPGQAVSGTFSYALSAGCAIVSTPIPHAKELHDLGNGLLFEFENPKSLATQILRYLDNPEFREELSRKAIETMAGTTWGNIANQYMALLTKLCGEKLSLQYRLHPLNTTHLEKMTTKTGVVQFARYHKPDPGTGYTLDDNARAMMVSSMLYKKTGFPKMLALTETYLQFIADCQLPDGTFINYRNEDGSVSNENNTVNLEDSNGRAIWALGLLVNIGKELRLTLTERASRILLQAAPKLEVIQSPRAIAFILKGLFYYNRSNSYTQFSLFEKLAEKLVVLYNQASDEKWKWFEPYLTYANSVLPEAVLIAGQVTGHPVYKQIALESFHFLLSKIFIGNQIRVISNKSWLKKGGAVDWYGEQPIDVAYTILALDRFHSVFGDQEYANKLKIAFSWFLGQNHLKRIIYNPSTGGCFDGLEEKGVNLNQGAESTVCYILARLTVDKYYNAQDFPSEVTSLFDAANPKHEMPAPTAGNRSVFQ